MADDRRDDDRNRYGAEGGRFGLGSGQEPHRGGYDQGRQDYDWGYGQSHAQGGYDAQRGGQGYDRAGGYQDYGRSHGQGGGQSYGERDYGRPHDPRSGQAYGSPSYGQGGYGQGGYGQDEYASPAYGQVTRGYGVQGDARGYAQERRPDYSGQTGAGYGQGRDPAYGGVQDRGDWRRVPAARGLAQAGAEVGDRAGDLWSRAKNAVAGAFRDDDSDERMHRGRGPKSYRRSDDRIHDDVNDRLTDDPFLDATHIDVGVADGEITLSGTVTSRADKRRAEDLADHVSGVKHVQNNLRLESGGATGLSAGSTAPAAVADGAVTASGSRGTGSTKMQDRMSGTGQVG